MSGLVVYLNVLTKPHFRQGSVLLSCDVDLSLVRHNWEKRLYKTLPANPQHTKRLSNTTSLINLEHISDYYTQFNGNVKITIFF